MNPVARLHAVEASKSILIPDQDHVKVAAIARGFVEREESVPAFCCVTGDAVVLVPPHDAVAIRDGVSLNF